MFSRYKLGKQAAHLPIGMPTLARHSIATMTPPVSVDRSHVGMFQPQMDANDSVGDCTAVAVANAVRAQAALQGYQVPISTTEVLRLYSSVTGYTPVKPASDTGAIETDMLAYQAKHGLCAGQEYVGLWANIPHDDMNGIRNVIARLGVVYIGLMLAEADQVGGGVWQLGTPASYGSDVPGSWGGHAALLWEYDAHTVGIVTWGRVQAATWEWLASRMDEAHVLAHPQLIGALGLNSAGIDFVQLAEDVHSYAT